MSDKPRCPSCGMPLPLYRKGGTQRNHHTRGRERKNAHKLTADGQPPKFGTRGSNIVCNATCAHDLLIKIVFSIPGVVNLLPPGFRLDLLPLKENPKMIKRKNSAILSARAAREADKIRRSRINTTSLRDLVSIYSEL